jgi:alkanesulfonate monooxygenase SsuD/methylene tetrahydromethanopterin reductase-like flavin-dependent oxidoreductase (luciferase family)
MQVLTLRFDMRAPDWAGPAADLYAAAIDMCAWAETRGAVLAVLSEHHAAEDGHLPAPLMLASAIAARTTSLAILIAAVPIPLWDPVRLSEEINVLDLISRGRVSYAFGIGHRPEEYLQSGVDFGARGRIADAHVAAVLELTRGGVTPRGTSPDGPPVMIAGGSRAAVRRAARHGLGFISQIDEPALKDYYDDRCRAAGRQPGFVQFPVSGAPTAVFVAENVDAAWAELGPHLLHDARMAASYRHGDDSIASITRAQDVAELRSGDGPYRILTIAEAADQIRAGRPLPLHPLCGGVAPDIAWRYLENAATAVDLVKGEHP